VVSSDNINAYGSRVTNVATPEDDTDATTKKYVDEVASKVIIDDKDTDKLNIRNISQEDYHELVLNDEIDDSTLYVVSSDNINAYGSRVTNVATAKEDTDAVNKKQVSDMITNILSGCPELNNLSSDEDWNKITVG
jgi:hypothetical protein